ncbi:MAG: type II secretion system F family protein [Acidimicrobiia bacterium]|nr:type II secretion system F family protein [Acidimicrobiia bacterium]
MTALLLAWWAAVLWGALLWRPSPAARRERLATLRPPRRRPPRRRLQPAASLGRALRSALGRPADAAADRCAGLVALVLLAGIAVDVTLGLAAAAACWLVLRRRVTRERRARGADMLAELPEALDLLSLAASAGLSVRLAVDAVAPRLAGPVGGALRRAAEQMRLGVEVAEALEALAAAPGADPLRLLVRPLTDALRYGSPLGPALERASAVARTERRRAAEAAARRVPLRLLFPLTVCVLPAFVLLTIVPTVAQSLDLLQF